MQTSATDAVPNRARASGDTLRMKAERTGSGPTLVLIGGGVTGWASWQPHAERLAASRDVIRLQLLAVEYGLEDRPLPAGYSVKTESSALAAALDGLDVHEPVDLVAWSYGALITLDFALNHPERVRTLTLIEPPAQWVLPGDDAAAAAAAADAAALRALIPAVTGDVSIETLVAFLRAAALVPAGVEPESLPQWESWVRHRNSLRAGPAPFEHRDDVARLSKFRRPVLLVTGDGTSDFLRGAHETLAATLPDVRTLELPGAHAPHLVAMDRFLATLARFHDEATTDHTAVSRDGTRIAYWRSGSGPALLLVHGATADHTTTWRLVREQLEQHFTVYAMDRRGRGGSGDAAEYALEREAEDVAAVIDAIGGNVHVLGHSYGALTALEAARISRGIESLILYEGVPLRGEGLYPSGVEQHIDEQLRAGDGEAALLTMYRDLVGMPAHEIELLRNQRVAWARRIRNVRSMPRELAVEAGYVFVPERFADVRARTLLLVGGDSPERELRHARGIAAALPDAQISVLSGQQHAAMYTAPAAVVAEVVRHVIAAPAGMQN